MLSPTFKMVVRNWSPETETSSAAFRGLATWLAEHLRVESAVLDGEIACVDDSGRPNFRSLLFRQRQCIFIAFDLLYLNGKDPRVLPLLERKAILKKLLRRKRSRILYLDHVESDGWRENRVHFSYASGFSGLIVSLKGGCERALSRSLLHKN